MDNKTQLLPSKVGETHTPSSPQLVCKEWSYRVCIPRLLWVLLTTVSPNPLMSVQHKAGAQQMIVTGMNGFGGWSSSRSARLSLHKHFFSPKAKSRQETFSTRPSFK